MIGEIKCQRKKPAIPKPEQSNWENRESALSEVRGLSTGCCRNPFSLSLKRFLINLRLALGDVKSQPQGMVMSKVQGMAIFFLDYALT